MAQRSEHRVIYFAEYLGNNADDAAYPWATFVGDQTTVKSFTIDGNPSSDAYLILQVSALQSFAHKILINGTDLAGFDIPPHSGWQTWMDAIDVGLLRQGNNTIQIERDSGSRDHFSVGNVAIHWRESD